MPDGVGLIFLGTLYGNTLCTLTCLPFLGVYIMGTGESFGSGVKASLFFLTGKLCSYILLGTIAGAFGKIVDLSDVQGKIFGVILIAVGVLLPFLREKKCSGCSRQYGRNMSLFAMGSGTSLRPCPPLVAIFVLAAQKGSWLAGASYGALFGLGMLISPLLLAGGGLAHIAGRIRFEAKTFAPYLHVISMIIMVFLGIRALA